MAKKGRPFTYQSEDDRPVTISVRLPAELTALVKRYAATHGQIPISELIREGLEWRIGDGDPRGMGMYLEESTGTREKTYYANTETASGVESSAALADMQTAIARQETQIQALAQLIEQQTAIVRSNVYSSNTENASSVVQDVMVPRVNVDKEEVIGRIQQMRDKGLDSTQIAETLQAEGVPTLSAEAQLQVVVDMLEHRAVEDGSEGNTSSTSPAPMATRPPVPATVLQAAQNPALARAGRPTFDPTRHHLGALCRNKHAWGSSGQSLRNADNQCLECKALAKREKDARKRAAREAATT